MNKSKFVILTSPIKITGIRNIKHSVYIGCPRSTGTPFISAKDGNATQTCKGVIFQLPL